MFFGTGLFHHGSTELRFLVMERFGKDVDKLFTSSGRKFDVATVLMLGLRVVSHMLFSFQNSWNGYMGKPPILFSLLCKNLWFYKMSPWDNALSRTLMKQLTNRFHEVSYDHCSYERNLSNCLQKPEKVRTSTGFEPVTSDFNRVWTRDLGSNPVEVLTFSGFCTQLLKLHS